VGDGSGTWLYFNADNYCKGKSVSTAVEAAGPGKYGDVIYGPEPES
jgi:hypothetical protein